MSGEGKAGWRSRAPGSLMCLGEHAVLHGKRALVCAVDRFFTVTLTPLSDPVIRIRSALGEDSAPLNALPDREPFRFLWRSVQSYDTTDWSTGFTLTVDADISQHVGFGSSAAVTVAALAAIDAWLGRPLDYGALHRRALGVIQAVQGRGSGADAAASIYGGLVEYRMEPPLIEPLRACFPITVIYSGYKTPTAEVIARVDAERHRRPGLFEGFFTEMDECVRDAVDAICRDDWAALGQCMNLNHTLMDAIGVNDPVLERMVQALRSQPEILGAKISGSGLGDCVIGLGDAARWPLEYERIPCRMTMEGVTIEQV